jgi:hypothetical protein
MGGWLCRILFCNEVDKLNIEDNLRTGERAAGWMFKNGKSSLVWSKRFFVLTDFKIIYYINNDRAVVKGEIVLAGAAASVSAKRDSKKNEFYFCISHPQRGLREFYVASNNQRMQWINKLNEVSIALAYISIYGKLYKQGGYSKTNWQERWCICLGYSLDYYENQTVNHPKGSIGFYSFYILYVISF